MTAFASQRGALIASRPCGQGEGRGSALVQAFEAQERAGAKGFDWPDAVGPLACVREETGEVAGLLHGGGAREALEEEVGDLLFAVVNLARAVGVEPRTALLQATRKFERRFRAVEELAGARGIAMPGAALERLDQLWDEVKEMEGRGGGVAASVQPATPDQ